MFMLQVKHRLRLQEETEGLLGMILSEREFLP